MSHTLVEIPQAQWTELRDLYEDKGNKLVLTIRCSMEIGVAMALIGDILFRKWFPKESFETDGTAWYHIDREKALQVTAEPPAGYTLRRLETEIRRASEQRLATSRTWLSIIRGTHDLIQR
ncbi:unnamed protein product [Ceratitis capitata]|uniref:(Mediterranean fruit fly) hypothetical protein n=1 Tax=Ceratitis capitata TaxID=7213 RepID=A0A811UH44_CERCA|nr:unnamed protein product [Ceratitis capitata]